ncbi:Putative FCP1 domain, HAD superfamily, mitochondrial import inner membrane translocase subunit Tim50 [Septoria linicola]|uniref:Mitochondrial import inner membrane translocase subunit TIM50 n=1 Tax=Septoria linicola TaxID=215465 RepID=A0A9Q9AMS8_9PEZI|nr:Putative FCP1 domain, HAD superfamily, mitochondrial import inner membrane translocase subunit Tim50 [Septoria linicola]
MLPRAALRASRPSHLLRHGASTITPSSSLLRSRAHASKPSRPPPPPAASSGSRPARPPPPPKAFTPATGPARQTSPGQPWTPKDGIKFDQPDAATPSGAGAASPAAAGGGGHAASSPVEGVRTADPASTQSPLQGDDPTQTILQMFQDGKGLADIAAYVQSLPPDQQQKLQDMTPNAAPLKPEQMEKAQQMHTEGRSWDEISREISVEQKQQKQAAAAPQEPIAQKLGADEPVEGSVREKAQERVAESENTPAPEAAAPEQTGPLPDLRHGIPSTFDLEFGQAKARAQQQDAAESQEDKLDLTSEGQRKSRDDGDEGERQYDRKAYETSLDRRRAMLMNYLYASFLAGAVLSAFYLGRPFGSYDEVPAGLEQEDAQGWGPQKIWNRMRGRLGNQVGHYTEPAFPKLLPDVPESQRPPFTLVMSLEDLMIHTTWDTKHGYRTAKRPGIDYFVRYLSQYYELVLFTSAPRAMADPIVAKLDPYHFIMWPLGREATKYENGEYVKDLSYLNRDLKKTIIVDTHAPHVKNQPENAIIIPKWSGDPKDPHTKDLVALIPFLEYVATMGTDDVRQVLKSFEGQSIPEEFARREQLAREKFQAQIADERRKKPKFSLGSIASGLGVQGGGMGGGMVLADGQSVAEGLRQGKMLSDQIREQGQKQYEHLEKQIREHGEQWLKEEAEELKKAQEAQMKDMKAGAFSWFGGSKKE